MDRDHQRSLVGPGEINTIRKRNERIAFACQCDPIAPCSQKKSFQFLRRRQGNVFLQSPRQAHCARIAAAVPGIDHDQWADFRDLCFMRMTRGSLVVAHLGKVVFCQRFLRQGFWARQSFRGMIPCG